MWVLKVDYREVTDGERFGRRSKFRSAEARRRGMYRVTSIEVLQSSNATSARLWAEDGNALQKGKEKETERKAASNSASGGTGGESEEEHENLFIANIPKELSLADCITDKSEFKTIVEQRAHFQEKMREMARTGHDEEDGWKFYCQTTSPRVAPSEQYVSREPRHVYPAITMQLTPSTSIRSHHTFTDSTSFSATCRGPRQNS